jgi:excinuclease UvrABC ATPase subunit
VRASFIRAYYVENSEDLEIVNAYLDNCPNCGGRGKIQEQMSTGQAQQVKCGVCHGTRFKRRIRAK